MRRIFICLFAALLCLSTTVSLASEGESGNEFSLSIGAAEGEAGQSVAVPVYIDIATENDTTGMESIEFVITYDSALITVVGAAQDKGFYGSEVFDSSFIASENPQEGVYRFAGITLTPITNSGILIELECQLLTGETAELTVSEIRGAFYDSAADTQTRVEIEDIVSDASIGCRIMDASDTGADDAADDVLGEAEDDVLLSEAEDDAVPSEAEDEKKEGSSTDWILWMACGLAVLLVIAGVVFAATSKKKNRQK